ncbi:N-acetylmuramidase domain-containing protein, partial [Zoogloea sp.]|uniref:N-acetylmuramidase domain-containing protein n=1 Tax=Zoogloea sp. TaxID=49181 RepID=UPI0031FDD062
RVAAAAPATLPFSGRGNPLSQEGLDQAASGLGVGLPALWAVMTVETKGCGFLADRRPLILFERHIFHRKTGGRFDASDPDISSRTAGGYGKGGANQYDRLMRAIALDRTAALESTSWGLGQVMGFNAIAAGYPDAESMVTAMCQSEDAQLLGMVGFIRDARLARHLKSGDWAAFAQGYNGPEFQKNKYDEKLRNAATRFGMGPLPSLEVRTAQLFLMYRGYNAGGVDGWFGENTQKALMQFQKDNALPVSGRLDDASLVALSRSA